MHIMLNVNFLKICTTAYHHVYILRFCLKNKINTYSYDKQNRADPGFSSRGGGGGGGQKIMNTHAYHEHKVRSPLRPRPGPA